MIFLLSLVQLSMLKLSGKHLILGLILLDVWDIGQTNSCFLFLLFFIYFEASLDSLSHVVLKSK